MRKAIIMLILMGTFTDGAYAQPVFLIPRLQEIAHDLELECLDTLKAGVHGQYSADGHSLRIRVNEYGEIDHIGIDLFSQETKQNFEYPLVLDFLERYALELVMTPEKERFRKLGMDKVAFYAGDIETFISLDGTEAFSFISHDQKKYRFSWYSPEDTENPILAMETDMDYQLVTGCNEKELDRLFIMMLQRFNDVSPEKTPEITSSEDFYIFQGDTYLRDYISSDLYYIKSEENDGSWKLIDDFSRSPQASLANLLLTGGNPEDRHLVELTVDQYGYKSLTILIPYRKLLKYCLSQGCSPYFRTREKKKDLYEASLFLVNNNYGYNHLLMIEAPFEELEKSGGIIRARMYCHIPMHNIADNYFN